MPLAVADRYPGGEIFACRVGCYRCGQCRLLVRAIGNLIGDDLRADAAVQRCHGIGHPLRQRLVQITAKGEGVCGVGGDLLRVLEKPRLSGRHSYRLGRGIERCAHRDRGVSFATICHFEAQCEWIVSCRIRCGQRGGYLGACHFVPDGDLDQRRAVLGDGPGQIDQAVAAGNRGSGKGTAFTAGNGEGRGAQRLLRSADRFHLERDGEIGRLDGGEIFHLAADGDRLSLHVYLLVRVDGQPRVPLPDVEGVFGGRDGLAGAGGQHPLKV